MIFLHERLSGQGFNTFVRVYRKVDRERSRIAPLSVEQRRSRDFAQELNRKDAVRCGHESLQTAKSGESEWPLLLFEPGK